LADSDSESKLMMRSTSRLRATWVPAVLEFLTVTAMSSAASHDYVLARG
jgi:hypothetical protein